MAKHLELGKKGEILAKEYLEEKDYEILDENWITGKLEVDLIALKDKVIVFIEVKTRTGNFFGEPEDFVNSRKQQLLVAAADEYIYLMEHKGDIRFDIVAVLFDKKNNFTIKHIEDAFWPTGN